MRPPELFYAVAREARRAGIPLDGHISPMPPEDASDSRQRIMDHGQDLAGICVPAIGTDWGEGVGGSLAAGANTAHPGLARCQALAARYRRNGTWSQLGPIGAEV